MKSTRKPIKKEYLKFGNVKVFPGERKRIQLDIASLFDYTTLSLPIEVIRGAEEGPIMFISSAIHGDELNGIEIIKRILRRPRLKKLKGTLILIPVVNIFGFNNRSRYLPDRRDLNRCFPGTVEGSLGSRLAHIFMKEIVSKCTHGIDLHTGAKHKFNLPQIRACIEDQQTAELARCFGVPVVINSKLRDGSLREAARKRKVCTLLFEGGEALRFDEDIIRHGVKGCLAVLEKIGMIGKLKKQINTPKRRSYKAQSSFWIRAPHSGSFKYLKKIGNQVNAGDVLAVITDPFGSDPFVVTAEESGIIIGISTIPLVNKGDAMIHLAIFKDIKKVNEAIQDLEEY